jgi:hypothetical protein
LPFVFLSCWLLLTAAPARGQFLWQRPVGTATNDESAEFTVPVAGGVVTLGKSRNNVTYPPEAVYLSKVDFAGNLVWAKRQAFARVNVLYPRALFADAAGNLVVSLIAVPPAPAGQPAPFSQGLLVKFNAQGDTLWTRRVRAPAAAAALDVAVPGNDGSYVAIGDYGSSLPALFKFSPAGALLWSQVIPYSTTRQGSLQNLVAVPNRYLVVSTPGAGLRSKYITVDELGNYQFERLGYINPPARLVLNSQGNILAVGGSITKLTVQGDSIWSRSYRQFGQLLGLGRLIELPNGNYLAAGARYNGTDDDLGLVLTDRNGARLRDTLLVRYQSDENPAGVALTPAGHYVVALGANPGPIGGADQLVFAYRSWNRLLPAQTARPQATARLTAHPNPTADALTLEANDARPLAGTWALCDLTGRPVRAGRLPGTARARLSLAGLPNGFYLLRVQDTLRGTAQTLQVEKR